MRKFILQFNVDGFHVKKEYKIGEFVISPIGQNKVLLKLSLDAEDENQARTIGIIKATDFLDVISFKYKLPAVLGSPIIISPSEKAVRINLWLKRIEFLENSNIQDVSEGLKI